MFPNLNAELARRGITILKLSKLTGIPYSTLVPKLRGSVPIKFSEAEKIKASIDNDLTLEYLFDTRQAVK